jgi:hypothetical protein
MKKMKMKWLIARKRSKQSQILRQRKEVLERLPEILRRKKMEVIAKGIRKGRKRKNCHRKLNKSNRKNRNLRRPKPNRSRIHLLSKKNHLYLLTLKTIQMIKVKKAMKKINLFQMMKNRTLMPNQMKT